MRRRVDAVISMGEVGSSIFQLLAEGTNIGLIGQDLDTEKNRLLRFPSSKDQPVDVLHICFPYIKGKDFINCVMDWTKKYPCKELVIHSTVKPGTTMKIQQKMQTPVIFSPVRGVHSRMLVDLKRYTKCWATHPSARIREQVKMFPQEMKQCGVKTKMWDTAPDALELAKILMDTTYYGWLIIFAQHVKHVCDRHGIAEDVVWKFTEEIHEILGNRPKMYSGEGIGGHCILPNLELLEDKFLDMVFAHDKYYKWRLNRDE